MVTANPTDHIVAANDFLNAAGIVDTWTDAQVLFGVGVKPAGAGWQATPEQSPFHPYGILWRIGSKDTRNLSLDDNTGREARVLLFVRVFGGFPLQADRTNDLVHVQMMGQTLTVPGRRLVAVGHDNGSTSTKSETLETSTYEAGNFYRIWTVPEG